jgi:glycosyltransferase involved in cell wall biosynthesis
VEVNFHPVPDFTDVALVSLGTTAGLRRVDEVFAQQLREAGVACEVAQVRIGVAGALRRHPAVTDLVESLAARRTRRPSARIVVFSTVTTALLQSHAGPYAVRFDSPAVVNRPGLAGVWQRRAERRALAGARCLLPQSEGASRAAPGDAPRVVVPVPVEDLPQTASREIDVLAYAGDPKKRGLDLLCRAWATVGGDARLVVGGIDPDRARRWLARKGVAEPGGVEWMGAVPREQWLDTLQRARLFVNASRWEDYGLSQLEALAAGAALVTVPSAGLYEALPLARRLESRLVADDLADALSAGLALSDSELERYRGAAADELAPYRPAAVQALVTERVVPALGLA